MYISGSSILAEVYPDSWHRMYATMHPPAWPIIYSQKVEKSNRNMVFVYISTKGCGYAPARRLHLQCECSKAPEGKEGRQTGNAFFVSRTTKVSMREGSQGIHRPTSHFEQQFWHKKSCVESNNSNIRIFEHWMFEYLQIWSFPYSFIHIELLSKSTWQLKKCDILSNFQWIFFQYG